MNPSISYPRIRRIRNTAPDPNPPRAEPEFAFRHGLAGAFMILEDEVREDFDELYDGLRAEHQPQTPTEILLIESMAQHYWLMQRAMRLQTLCFDLEEAEAEKKLALFLRYQTTHERAFYKSLNTLVKLRADKRKTRLDEAALCQRAEDSRKIGFVSQEMKQDRARQQAEREQRRAEEHARKQAVEKRKQEIHKWKVLRAQAEVDQRVLQNLSLNLQNPEYRLSVSAERIIAAENAA